MRVCRRMRERALRELDRELNVDQALELDAHLAECAACREFVRGAQSLEEALLGLGEAPVEPLDIERNVLAIRARLDAPTASPQRSPRHISRRPWIFAAAAAAGVALFAWWGTRREHAEHAEHAELDHGGSLAAPETFVEEAPQIAAAAEVARSESARVEVSPGPEVVADLAPESAVDFATQLAPQVALAARSAPSFDPERHEAARASLRELLRSASAHLPIHATSEQVVRFADEVDALAPANGLVDWPLPRLAAALLDDASPEVARAALRYVGLRGDRLSTAELERRATDDVEALLARLERFDGDSAAVRAACVDPQCSSLVLERLAARAQPVRARVLRGVLETRPEGEVRRSLLDQLIAGEPSDFDAVARLTFDGLISRDEAARAAGRLSIGADTFAALAARPGERVEPWIELAASLRMEPMLPWIESLARQPRTRDASLGALERFGRCPSLDAILRLVDSGVAPVESLDRALALVLDGDARQFRGWIDATIATCDARVAARLLDALAGSRKSASSTGLLSIALADKIALEERELALEALAELAAQLDPDAAAEAIDELTGLFRTLDARERRLAAACVIAVHRIGGETSIDLLLAGAPRRAAQRVLDVIAVATPRSVSRVQLARALEPWLDARSEPLRGGTP